jgi:hypothetical protein
MKDLDVRSPTPTAGSPDVMARVLATARATQAPKLHTLVRPPPAPPKPEALLEIEARKPPGPQAKKPAAPPPLKGPGPATPPKGPSAEAAAAAAKAAAAKAAGVKPEPAPAPPAPPPAPVAVTAASLIDVDAAWLPDEDDRKTAFLQVFRYWHAQVRPEFAHKARPAFLFLVTALPVMVKARDTLIAQDLWEPHGDQSREKRDQHYAWKKYCEFLPRAQQALQELDDYRHLSLLTALDDLSGRITRAEARFREGIGQPAKSRR